MWQWKGHWKPRFDDNFVMSTDMLPTFMSAANIRAVDGMHFDGTNILSFLENRASSATEERRPTWYSRQAAIFDQGEYDGIPSQMWPSSASAFTSLPSPLTIRSKLLCASSHIKQGSHHTESQCKEGVECRTREGAERHLPLQAFHGCRREGT
jgi:hypothetical protein